MSESYEIIPVQNVSAVEAISRADFDVQIATAKRYPMHSDQKGLERFRNDAITMATLDQDTAESCLYAVPRGGKSIEGKSVRLAEIVVASYGNIKAGARVIEINDTEVVAQGVCHDLERNVSQSSEVRRRITDKNGKRYNEDVIILTCNAACSIAFRNAVFKVIPAALCEPVYKAAKALATGNKQTLDIRRAKAIQQFALMGVTQEQILVRLNKSAITFIDGDDLATLIGLYNSIKNGESSVDETFPQIEGGEKVSGKSLTMNMQSFKLKLENLGASLAEALEVAKSIYPETKRLETLTGEQADKVLAEIKRAADLDAERAAQVAEMAKAANAGQGELEL